ncbi:DUF3467 domain-containing protein [bacterium]|nr:DUF3467 domain-containing protein [bacterium]
MLKEGKRVPVQIDLDEAHAEGVYSNLVVVSHSHSEFILDFVRILPGMKKGKVYSRVVMSPQNTKMLLRTLQDNIGKYESKFGEISVTKDSSRHIGFDIDKEGK